MLEWKYPKMFYPKKEISKLCTNMFQLFQNILFSKISSLLSICN